MRLRRPLPVAAATISLLLASAAGATSYDIVTFSRPSAAQTYLFDVNNNGQVVGQSRADADPLTPSEAFIYESGMFTALTGPAGAFSVNALGISDTGTVVGSYSNGLIDDGTGTGTLIFGPSSGFIYDGAVYTTFSIAGATDTYLRHISPDGRYLSGYYTSASDFGQGFLYDSLLGHLTLIGAGGTSAFTIVQGINSSYVSVGSDVIFGAPTTRPGFTYDVTTGNRIDVQLPGANRTAFRDISDAGVITGWYEDTSGVRHGFSGYPGSVDTIDVAGASNTFGEGSNNAGIVVGNFDVGGTVFGAFIATPLPEPSTSALLLAAGALAARRARRKRGH